MDRCAAHQRLQDQFGRLMLVVLAVEAIQPCGCGTEQGEGARVFLATLQELVAQGKTPADRIRDRLLADDLQRGTQPGEDV